MPNNSTFNRGNNNGLSQGFYSRTLFTWVIPSSLPDLSGSETWTLETNGDGLQYLVNNYPSYCHGGFSFPAYYWVAGKTIRFKGTFFVRSTIANQRFNMRFGLKEFNGNAVEWLAIQNNNNDHTFLSGGTRAYDTPVNFNCLLMCSNLDSDGSAWFTANGFYTYPLNTNQQDPNRNIAKVPVWTNGSGTNGVSNDVATDYINYQTHLMMNCYNSDVLSIQLLNLTIEELL
jgi:hypothetical protein